MIRLLILLSLFVTSAHADDVDLTNLPSELSFTSRSSFGDTIVTYLGTDQDLFKFEFQRPAREKGKRTTDVIWVNRASQSVRLLKPGGTRFYDPHDCAPGLGTCYYDLTWEDGTVDRVKRVSRMVGDIEVDSEYIMVEGEALFWTQTCTTFDQYGFWIDYVRRDFEDDVQSARRVQSSYVLPNHSAFEDIVKICQPAPELTS